MASRTSEQLDASLATHLWPLIAPLGFEALGPPDRAKVGLVARTFGRLLSNGTRLVLSVWCDGGTAENLSWRLDVADGNGMADLQLTFPYEIEGKPACRPSGGSHHLLGEFRPHLDLQHLERAIRSLACQLAAHAEEIARQVPELASDLSATLTTPVWRAALTEGPLLWARRYVEQEDDARLETGEVGFAGENLVRVHTSSGRYSFKFPAKGISKGDAAELSAWWRTPANTWIPRRLRIADKRREFDFFHRLVSDDSGPV